MKSKSNHTFALRGPGRCLFATLILLSTLNSQLSTQAQGTAFTYQGSLTDNGAPASGQYSLRSILYNAEFGGSQIGPTLTNEPVAVADGLFTTTLDFGATVLDGSPRWLEVAVRTNGSAAVHTALSPRQPLGSAPYAFRAARLTGTLPDDQLSTNVARLNDNGTFVGNVLFDPRTGPPFAVGNSEVVIKLNADQLDGLDAAAFALADHNHDANYWKLTGNAGTSPTNGQFFGTTDNRPLEFRVNNQRVLRIEPDGISANLIGGRFNYATNIFFQSAARGVVIGGGGQSTLPNVVQDDFGVIVGGSGNTNNGDSSFIGAGLRNYVEDRNNVLVGGLRNSLDGRQCFLGAGENNRILSIAIDSVLTGGANNTVRADFATLGGGANNLIDSSSDFGTVSGGANNHIDFGILYGTIPGGLSNFVDGDYAFAAGRRARAVHDGAFVWADATDANFASTGANQFLIRASGGMGLNVAQPRGELHVGNSSNAAPISAASQTIIIEHAAENGRAAFLALAGPGASTSTNRVELQLEANESERRAIIGTTSNHEIQFRQNNGVRVTIWTNGFVGIGNTAPTNRLVVVNARCDGSSWINSSDRNLKENFAPVDTQAVLEKVTALPLTRWNYKDDPGTPHLGPVAQDFKAGFGLGADDTSIATVDADGVALAAIQGLNQKVEEKETRILALEEELAALKELVAKIATTKE